MTSGIPEDSIYMYNYIYLVLIGFKSPFREYNGPIHMYMYVGLDLSS